MAKAHNANTTTSRHGLLLRIKRHKGKPGVFATGMSTPPSLPSQAPARKSQRLKKRELGPDDAEAPVASPPPRRKRAVASKVADAPTAAPASELSLASQDSVASFELSVPSVDVAVDARRAGVIVASPHIRSRCMTVFVKCVVVIFNLPADAAPTDHAMISSSSQAHPHADATPASQLAPVEAVPLPVAAAAANGTLPAAALAPTKRRKKKKSLDVVRRTAGNYDRYICILVLVAVIACPNYHNAFFASVSLACPACLHPFMPMLLSGVLCADTRLLLLAPLRLSLRVHHTSTIAECLHFGCGRSGLRTRLCLTSAVTVATLQLLVVSCALCLSYLARITTCPLNPVFVCICRS